MKGLKVSLVIMAAALLTIGLSGMAYAFHSGGVAECEGCHSMHSPKTGAQFLLVGSDQSSACLSCHEHAGDTGPSSYHVGTPLADVPTGVPPKQRTPGGDFGWLRKTYTFGTGTADREDGATHGHNIIALDNGYTVDPDNAIAPGGGSFPSNQLACSSCHDPHGQYRRLSTGVIAKTGAPIKASGSYNGTANEPTATEAVGVYRLLAGAGYTKGGVTFNGVPAAKAPSTYNQSEVTNQVRVAYGVSTSSGHETWGQWCATCHPNMLVATAGNHTHPVDQNLGSTTAGLYNSYKKSGDMTGTSATSFLSLVPFATNSSDYTALAALASNTTTAASTVGPDSSSQVTCFSCHRAHASGFRDMLRFDNGYEFTVVNGNYVGSDNPSVTGSRAPQQHRGRLIAEWQAAFYDRPATNFATYQRVLCNKCHAKD